MGRDDLRNVMPAPTGLHRHADLHRHAGLHRPVSRRRPRQAPRTRRRGRTTKGPDAPMRIEPLA